MSDDTSERTHDPVSNSSSPRLVVGLGGSAGGIKALQDFIAHVPSQSGAVYVVILHLSPEHDSKLAEVLQSSTRMPVAQVTDRTAIAADHVYVIPPSRNLSLRAGMLVLSEQRGSDERRAPIDLFFRTLAQDQGSAAVCVILSGTGSDGSSGLKTVKEAGGLVIAQDPDNADYSDMPRQAIATGLVDYVLPTSEMPSAIVDYARRAHAWPFGPEPSIAVHSDGAREILGILRARTGHDFSNYKTPTVVRRIQRRMHVRGLTAFDDYARFIRGEPSEASALLRELLISVTHFFRDPEAWAALEERVIPRLFDGRRGNDQVRVWVVGCATGEEAYSVAMLLSEAATKLLDPPSIQVFASDLDEQAIGTARDAWYSTADAADIPQTRLQRFFRLDEDGYRVRRELRELVLFAHHNVIRDPPFSHLDLIACRNLLIYLNRSIQDRLLETFHFALRPGGYLFLGTSESPDGANDLFVAIDKTAHFYEMRSVTTRLVRPLHEPTSAAPYTPISHGIPNLRATERFTPSELHHRLLEEYAPPSVVVSEDFAVVHLSKQAGAYLHMSGGEPSRDVVRLALPELRVDLGRALIQARERGVAVSVNDVRAELPTGERVLTLHVRPVMREDDPARGFFVVFFEDQGVVPIGDESEVHLTSRAHPEGAELQDELSRLQTQLRITVEQYEVQVEEARAANEELQAINEELRSAAEELETSKEELQSVNEELTTVNQELKIKIEELSLTSNDFQNLIQSTEIATIFLDRSLRVKLSTPRAQELFNLLPSDAGRPLSDITSKLPSAQLFDDVAEVLERLQVVERYLQRQDGRWFHVRVLPYRTMDDRIDGVVITSQDVTDRRAAEQRVAVSEERLRLLIDGAIDYAIFTMDENGRFDSWNAGAERMFGHTKEEIVGQPFATLFTPEDRAAGMVERELTTAITEGRASDERWHLRKDGQRLYCSGSTMRVGQEKPFRFAKITRDLTFQQRAREELEARVRERTLALQTELAEHAGARGHVEQLLRKLVTAQEDERARIARDLHDQLGQQLTTLRLALEQHKTRVSGDGSAQTDLDRALALTRNLDAEVDFLAWELRPAALDDLGLKVALPRFVQEWAAHYRLEAECRTARFESGLLTREAELVFYRIAQEALNNTLKHAHATRIDLILERRDSAVVLVVEDDGIGFDPANTTGNGIGLAGMRERAQLVGATLEVESAPGKGTTVFLHAPVHRADPA